MSVPPDMPDPASTDPASTEPGAPELVVTGPESTRATGVVPGPATGPSTAAASAVPSAAPEPTAKPATEHAVAIGPEITYAECRQCGTLIAGLDGRYSCGVCGWVNHHSEGHRTLPRAEDDTDRAPGHIDGNRLG